MTPGHKVLSVVLVGLPGAGKSTVGRHLAKSLSCDFIDTDGLVEQRVGCSIHEIFEREGEERFRDLEAVVLDEVLSRPVTSVIATGGGIVKRAQNRVRIAESAVTVYLHASPRDLASRLRHDVRRPLLQGGDRLEKFETLFRDRHALYSEMAQVQVDAIGRPLQVLLRDIVELLDRHVSAGDAVADASARLAQG